MTVQLVMELPDKTTPGFVRRSMKALEFSDQINAGQMNHHLLNEMIDFLLPYVKEPEDRKAAREALLDASEEQFYRAMAAMTGSGDALNPTSAGT